MKSSSRKSIDNACITKCSQTGWCWDFNGITVNIGTNLGLRDGRHQLHDAVRDGLLELEAALLSQERRQEADQHPVLQGILEAQLHTSPHTRQTNGVRCYHEENITRHPPISSATAIVSDGWLASTTGHD